MTMQLRINGELKELEQSISVDEFLSQKDINKNTIVCELNKQILPKEEFSTVFLKEDDILEIVQFVGGG